jgi:hypothetical protein
MTKATSAAMRTGVSSTTPYAASRREASEEAMAAKISIQLRARAGTGVPETLTFSYTTGGEQDAPVELRIGDGLYRLDRDDLLAFARAIGGKG